MSLDKNKTIAEIGRRTRLRRHGVQKMLEVLIRSGQMIRLTLAVSS